MYSKTTTITTTKQKLNTIKEMKPKKPLQSFTATGKDRVNMNLICSINWNRSEIQIPTLNLTYVCIYFFE